MSKDNQHINQLLQRWLSGEARREEAGRLEKLAAEDPFLADAIDGYDNFPASEHLRRLEELRVKLPGNSASERLIPTIYYIRRIAAGLSILVVASVAFWFISRYEGTAGSQAMEPESDRAAAVAESQQEGPVVRPAEGAAADTSLVTPTAPPLTTGSPADATIALRDESKKTAAAKPKNEVNAYAADDLGVDDGAARARESRAPARLNTLPAPVSPNAPAGAEEEGYDFSQPNAAYISPNQRIIDGIVTDESGQPLIGANVLVPGSNVGTLTSRDGSFRLIVDKDARNLSVSYTGYRDKQVALGGKSQVNIAMDAGQALALEEVQTSAYARKDAQQSATTAAPSATPTIVAEPKGGFRRLERHIRKNQQPPPDLPEGGGSVTVQFMVNPDGTLSDLKILRSNCATCHPEALRLIQSGPEWTLENSDKPVLRNYEVKLEKE